MKVAINFSRETSNQILVRAVKLACQKSHRSPLPFPNRLLPIVQLAHNQVILTQLIVLTEWDGEHTK